MNEALERVTKAILAKDNDGKIDIFDAEVYAIAAMKAIQDMLDPYIEGH